MNEKDKEEAFTEAYSCLGCTVKVKDGMFIMLPGGGIIGMYWEAAVSLHKAGKLREYIETEAAISLITDAAKGIADAENGSQGSN